MKITSLQAFYPKYQHVVPSWRTHFWQIVIRVDTNSGISGYGLGGGGVAALEVVNRDFSELLIDREIESIEDISKIWDDLYFHSIPYGRKGLAIMALSGVDLALWDLVGKAENVPVHSLIGNRKKSKVRAYATGIDSEWYSQSGYTAHKFPHRWESERDYDSAVTRAETARNAMGPNALLMIDTYMTWNNHVTKKMSCNLKGYGIYWFEDVLTPDDLEDQSKLREVVKPTLISGGEHEFTHYGFREIARSKALDLWQPDITWCGGITAGLKIIDLAESENIPVVPHRGGEVWGLHLIVASGCENLAEILPGTRESVQDDLWLGEPQAIEGLISPTNEPGFGVTVNEDLMP